MLCVFSHRAGGRKKSTLTGFVGAERQYSMFRHNKFRHLTFDRYVYRSYVYCPHPDTKHTLRPPTPAPDKHSRSRKLRFQRSRLDRGAKSQDDHETAEQSHKTTTRPTADQRTRATADLDPFSHAEQAQSAMPATLVPTSAQPLCFPSMAGCSGCQPAPWSSPSLTKSSYPRRTVSSCTRPAPNARPMSSLSPQAAGRASIDAARASSCHSMANTPEK